MFTRASACHDGLIKGGHVVDGNVSLYELNTTMMSCLPMTMLHPGAIQECNHASRSKGVLGVVPREPRHARTSGPRVRLYVGNPTTLAAGESGIRARADALALGSARLVLHKSED